MLNNSRVFEVPNPKNFHRIIQVVPCRYALKLKSGLLEINELFIRLNNISNRKGSRALKFQVTFSNLDQTSEVFRSSK